ncbi:hypothetical protein SAMN05421846_102250 [Chryseobacterium taeanense]|uniref:Uncharacterized protein n=1 Tax=Chryseobacterium taeanense TaxID=311334 RepID=A0A1G8FRQ5_9FLAO|nr:hypothetical protein SAMN05421846_102250 [Chryseobacterium taeanense]
MTICLLLSSYLRFSPLMSINKDIKMSAKLPSYKPLPSVKSLFNLFLKSSKLE